MPKWFYMQPIHADCIGYVEADTREEAEKLAFDDMHMSVCCQCSKHIQIGDASDHDLILEKCSKD